MGLEARPEEIRRDAHASGAEIQRIQVLADGRKEGVRELIDPLQRYLSKRANVVRVETDIPSFCRARRDSGSDAKRREDDPDLLVVLGGDGAILAAASAFRECPVPTLGINFGRVGFLAACPASRWREVLEGVLEGTEVSDERMRLAVRIEPEGSGASSDVALNEVVVGRDAFQGMLTISVAVGEDWLGEFRADGLIVATPSGSTAYSLAAGGPILAPMMAGMVVTPVASQSLANRPIVLHHDSELTINVVSSSGPATLVVDGHGQYPLEAGTLVRVRRHPEPYPLLSMPGLDPYRRLRSRLGWSRGPVPSPGDADE